MKLAFSTASFLDRNLGSAVGTARECGYEGVDVGAVLAGSVVAEPAESRRVAEAVGVEICCIESAMDFVGEDSRDRQSAEQIRKFIDGAAEMKCGFVQVGANTVLLGRSAVSSMMGDWLAPLGDQAAKCGVKIALVNQKTFGASRDIWAVLDRLGHPAIGCCWNILTAATMGERPGVSVPTLNSRIRMVRVADAKISDEGVAPCELGDGDVAVEQFLKRLRGIGFGGYVIVDSAGNVETLAKSAKRLREWWSERTGAKKVGK